MAYQRIIFEKFDMTESEKEFIESVFKQTGSNISYGDGHNILSNFYLAKQIELSSKSSDRSAKVMTWLTIAIVFFTAVQGFGAIFPR